MSNIWVDNVDKAVIALQGQIEQLKKKADEVIPSPMEVKPLPKVASSSFTSAHAWKVNAGYFHSSLEPTTVDEVERLHAQALELLIKDLEAMKAVHEANIPAIENNKKIHEKVTIIMRDMLKIPSSYSTYEFKTNRSSKKTETKHSAGYLGDLSRNIKTDDGYTYTVSQVERYKETFAQIANSLKSKIIAAQREKEKEEKNKKAIQVLARLQVKYSLHEDSDWADVLAALDDKCKYFALARALEDQRGDWSCGFDRVQCAVDAFVVETEEDKEIFESLHELAYDEDLCDGRAFRDCEWNYSALYGKADENVLADYKTLSEYYNRY